MKLSVIICAYNERQTILDAIHQAHAVGLGAGWDKEVIVVDNFSTDGTRELLQSVDLPHVRAVFHPRNLGKSASILTGIAEARGDYKVSLRRRDDRPLKVDTVEKMTGHTDTGWVQVGNWVEVDI